MLVSGAGRHLAAERREGCSEGQPEAEAVVSLDSTGKLNRAKFCEAHRNPVGTILMGGGGSIPVILRGLPSETMRWFDRHLRPEFHCRRE
jgi:hypothetical protein